MKSISTLLFLMMFLPVTQGWGQKVDTRFDPATDFQRYKTYAWGERKLLTMQDPENQKLIDLALVSAVNAQLHSKGLTEEQSAPDFYVTYKGGATVADSKSGFAYSPADLRGWGAVTWSGNTIPGSVPNVWVSMRGVLLFEITDAKTNAITWSTLLTKKLKNPGKMPKDLDKAAAEIANKGFQDFPPKPGDKQANRGASDN